MSQHPPTLSAKAYEAIRSAIVTGRLRPGAKLVVRPLAEELHLSPTPIKAALAALEGEGFVVAIPHRGYFVPEVSSSDMREIYELREVIDGIAARNAARKRKRAALTAMLRRLLSEQRQLVGRGHLSGYSDLDLRFHQAIWHASSNSRLTVVAENLVGQVRAGSGGSSRLPGRLPTALREHEAIIAAIADGDHEEAERLARAHVRMAGKALDAVLLHPEQIIDLQETS